MAVRPVINGRISSRYGNRTMSGHVQFHKGIDIGSHEQPAPVQFAFPGTVVKCGWSDTFGNRVWQRIIGGQYHNLYAVYGHLDSIDSSVKEGVEVNASDALGIMGSTGMSTAIHLHFEIRTSTDMNGTSINPTLVTDTYGILE